jgi:chromosome segregation ATPase
MLDETLPGDANSKQLLSQLQVRDQRIDELNARIQAAETQLASVSVENYGAKDRQIMQMQEEKAKLMREIQGLEEQNAHLDSQLNAIQQELTEVKENAELLQEGLSEESEQLRSAIGHKDESIKNAKQDIVQLSKIVGEMSKLNTELNEKILIQNTEIEKLNSAQYQLNVKSVHSDEIEVAYTELKADFIKSQTKNKKLNDENSRLRVLEESSRMCMEKLKTAEDMLTAGTTEPNVLLEIIQGVRHELKTSTSVQRSIPDDPMLLKGEIAELKSQIKEMTAQIRKTTNTEAAHLERMKFLEEEKLTIKRQMEEAIERLQKRITILQDSAEKAKLKAEKFEQDLLRTDGDLQKANTQVLSLQSQINLLKLNRKEVANVETKLQATIRDLKAQVNVLKSQKSSQESSITAREQRLKATATKLKVLADETWRRDTEILKGKKAITRLQDEIAKIRSNEQNTHAKAKTKIAEEMGSVNVVLEDKDREIGILREMIRGMQQQLKTKELELSRYRRRTDEDPIREVTAPRLQQEPGLKKLATRMDTGIKEIEELVELKKKLQGEGKIPVSAVKKALLIESVPKDKSVILGEVSRKLSDSIDNLSRYATSKQSFSLSSSHFSNGAATSSLLSSLLQASEPVSVSAILERVKALAD